MTRIHHVLIALIGSIVLVMAAFVRFKHDTWAHFVMLPGVSVSQMLWPRADADALPREAAMLGAAIAGWCVMSYCAWCALRQTRQALRQQRPETPIGMRDRLLALTHALLMLVVVGAVVVVAIWPIFFTADARYRRVVWSIHHRLIAALPRDSSDETSRREEEARIAVISALQTALANAQCHYRETTREKVRQIARELDRDQSMLRTREGLYRLWLELEDECPALREYIWITQLREMQAGGRIPRFDEAETVQR